MKLKSLLMMLLILVGLGFVPVSASNDEGIVEVDTDSPSFVFENSDKTFYTVLGSEVKGTELIKGLVVYDLNGNVMDVSDDLFIEIGDSYEHYTPDEAAVIFNQMIEDNRYNGLGEPFLDYKIGLEFYRTEYDSRATVLYVVHLAFKAKDTNVYYATQIENVGWQGYVLNGGMSGTEGQGLRLEGLKIYTDNTDLTVNYETHIQNIGWESENGIGLHSNNELSGTVGKSLRLEGVRISLSGKDADLYDIYYRVHAQNIGWLGWACNGDEAGTAGYGYRLEGIQIKILEKGTIKSDEVLKDARTWSTFIDSNEIKAGKEQLVEFCNNLRAKEGLQPLIVDTNLSNIAQNYVPMTYAGSLHEVFISKNVKNYINSSGIYNYGCVYMFDYDTLDLALEGLPVGTLSNILDPKYTRVGTGYSHNLASGVVAFIILE